VTNVTNWAGAKRIYGFTDLAGAAALAATYDLQLKNILHSPLKKSPPKSSKK
jgi:hypothetical protein